MFLPITRFPLNKKKGIRSRDQLSLKYNLDSLQECDLLKNGRLIYENSPEIYI